MKKISEIVYEEIADFKQTKIKSDSKVNGSYFNQYDNIKRINKYLHDEFLERNDGIFWNISTPRIPHFAKNIDLDTKDFYPYAVGDNSFAPNWILRMKFYAWCRESGFALTLNDLAEGLATYGSIVWKKTYDEEDNATLRECNLENLYFNQKAKTVRETPVVELHYMTETELRHKGWDNTDKIIKKAKENKKNGIVEFEIWERWGEFGEDDDIKYWHHIGYGQGDSEIICIEDEEDAAEMPYYDFHLGRYSGRWQRIGVVERLYNLQVRINELVNQNAKTTEIASLLILRSQDANMDGNVLTGIESGQVLTSTDLQQVGIQNPGLSNFINELTLIEQQADKLCMTPAVMTGQKTPAGMPFRGLALLSETAINAFDFIRQSVGERIKDILLDEILPDIVNTWNRGELLEIAGEEEDVQIYDNSLKRSMEIQALLNGTAITPEIRDQISQMVDDALPKMGRTVKIPKGYFDFEYKIRINPTGESFDLGKQNDAYNNAITWVLQNPAVLDIPLFRQYLENNGIEWERLKAKQIETLKQNAVSVPTQPQPMQATPQAPNMALQQ